MDNLKSRARFKVATIRHPKDGQPKVVTFSIDQLVRAVSQAPVSLTIYDAYHFQKSEKERLTTEARAAWDADNIERAKELKGQAALYGTMIDNTKFGPAILPFVFKDDVTFKIGDKGWPQRDNRGITHFSLLMLDVESRTTKEELHEVLLDFEYILWPTIAHRPDDPRYRIVLFPAAPLTISDAQAVIYRIDARLPPRNDPSKKLQNLDPGCTDVGRFMFLPKWLTNHPEPYSIVRNSGNLVTSAAFAVTPQIQESINARISAADEHRSRVKANSLAIIKSAPATSDSLLVTVNGKDYLNPDAYFETKSGYVRLSDVKAKIGGVRCPFHADKVGSEFIAPNMHTGRPQFVCTKCRIAIQMAPAQTTYVDTDDEIETDVAAFAKLVKPRPKMIEFAEPPNVHYFSDRFLPDIRNIVPDRGLLFVRSPKGTGKTEALYHLVEAARSAKQTVILLTHRRSLARNLSSRLGLANYQDLENGTLSDFSVVCVNSLTSRLDESKANYDLVIVDESEQVLRNLLSKTLEYNLSDIFYKILLLIQNAKKVICLDADLSSDLTVGVIAQMRDSETKTENDDYIGVINEFQIGAGKAIRSLPNRHQLLTEISRASDAGKKLFVACSTARAAMAIGEMLKAQGKRVLVITATTSEDPEVVAFQHAPNDILADENAPKRERKPPLITLTETTADLTARAVQKAVKVAPVHYDAVVASPSLQTGFSIDVPYFDHVYGWFQGVDGITYQDYDQALSRVRHCDDVTVWVEGTARRPNLEPLEFFIERAKMKELKATKRLPGMPRVLSEAQLLWVRIEAMINYLTALWSHQRDAKFKAMKRELGFTVEEIPRNETDEEAGKLLWDTFKDAGPDYAASVFNATILDYDEFLELQRRNQKTNDDHLALRRYRIAAAIDQELTLDLVTQAIDTNLLETLAKARSLVLDHVDTSVRHDVEDRIRQHTAFTKASHRTLEHELLVEHLCQEANIDIKSYYARLSAGEEIEIPVALLDQVVDAFNQRHVDFQFFFQLRIESTDRAVKRAKAAAKAKGVEWTPDAEAKAVEKAKEFRRKRVWDGTFKKVGLPLSNRKRGPRGNQVPYYYIDPEAAEVKLFLEAIQKEQGIRDRIRNSIEAGLSGLTLKKRGSG